MNDDGIVELWARIGNGIVFKVNQSNKRDDIVKASQRLLGRLVDSGSTLRILFEHAKQHDWTADGATILRTTYDAMIQALYILADPKEQQQRARRFLDFSIVERVKILRLADARRTAASRQIADSKLRAGVESDIQNEFKRVCSLYGYDMKKPPTYWYKGSLRDLAKAVGYETEYEILHKQLSATAHSSMFGLTANAVFSGFNALQLYWLFAFRVLGKFVDYVGITLSDTEKGMLALADRNVLDGHS
jgi:hypothetical protein